VRLALSGACAPDWPLEDELAGAAAAGYEAVELWLPKLWAVLERSGPEAVVAALGRRRLAAAALAPIPDATFRDRTGLEAVTASVHGAAALARAFGAPWVVIQPGERPDGADERDAFREARHTLGQLALAVERYDVGLAISPLGYPWASIRTVREAGDIIEAVGRKSLGLAVDTFHMHLAGSRPEDVGHLRARWIWLLRLADAPAGEVDALRESHRLPPGEGVIPLAEIVGRVRALGAPNATAVVACPFAGGLGEATAWVKRLRERAAGVLHAPAPAGRRSA
jgi:2-keto-myo-inositol isomerase